MASLENISFAICNLSRENAIDFTQMLVEEANVEKITQNVTYIPIHALKATIKSTSFNN